MVSTETILMGLLTILAIFIVSEGMLDIRWLHYEACWVQTPFVCLG